MRAIQPPGGPDPIAKLMEDHRVFLLRVASFRELLPKGSAPAPETLPGKVAEFSRFLAHDVDKIHGQQEERGLFPVLGRYLPTDGGPIGVMLEEHTTLRGYQSTLERGGRRLASDPAAPEAMESLRAVTRGVDQLLADHVMKEDTVLFPMAYQVLSPRDLAEIAQVFQEVAADG